MTDHPPSDSVFSEKGFPQTRTQVLTEADVLITAALVDRLARQPDLAAENQAFVRLAQQLTDDPQSRLKALVQIARDLCQADTVGVSLLETLADGSSVFRWVAIAGVLEGLEQTAVPSNSPCGATIRCGQPQLYARPERYFTYLHQSQFPIVEGLVIPICVNDQPLGTLWILSHTEQRQFDREDLRLMASLAGFAAAALQNVNLRQTAALALQESEAFNHSIFESSADCIKLLDLNGCLLSMNGPGLCLMEVKDCTPLVGTAWIEFWQDSDRADAAQAVKTAKAGRTGRLSGYCPTLKGTSKWWDVVVTPVLDVLGQPKQLLVISRDISDRKSAEAEREQLLQQEQAAREAAEQANQIKDEFLAVPSHELRSPLNPILGWTKLLRRGKLNTGKTAEALATIERNAKLQCQLIEDLLDISRVMQGKLLLNVAPVSLAFVISSAIETVRLAAEVKNIGIEVYLEPHMGQVSGDAGRL